MNASILFGLLIATFLVFANAEDSTLSNPDELNKENDGIESKTENEIIKRYRLHGGGKRYRLYGPDIESRMYENLDNLSLEGDKYDSLDKRYRLNGKRNDDDSVFGGDDDEDDSNDLYVYNKRYRLQGKRYNNENYGLNKRYRIHGKRYRLYGLH